MNSYPMGDIATYQFRGGSSFIEITVIIDRAPHKLQGRRMVMQEIGPPTVVLLSDKSTTTDPALSSTAEADFIQAATELVKNGKGFYTELRPGWSVPSLYWTKAKA